MSYLCNFRTFSVYNPDFIGYVTCPGVVPPTGNSFCDNAFRDMIDFSDCDYFTDTTNVDTVFVCDDSFYNDFNNAVNNKAMGVFLASVMAGILAVRAVIKIIKAAVR
jgi:hypothetical protein